LAAFPIPQRLDKAAGALIRQHRRGMHNSLPNGQGVVITSFVNGLDRSIHCVAKSAAVGDAGLLDRMKLGAT